MRRLALRCLVMVWVVGCGGSSKPPPPGADKEPPTLALKSPADGSASNQPNQRVELEYADASGIALSSVKLEVDGQEVNASLSISDTGAQGEVTLSEGAHTLVARVADKPGNESRAQARVIVDRASPALAFTALVEGSTLYGNTQALALTYTDGLSGVVPSTFRLLANGQDLSSQLTAGESGAQGTVALAEGPTTLVARVQDKAGNLAEATLHVTVRPELEVVASPLDDTAVVPFNEATAFLYTGPNAIQVGVAPGTMDAKRVAVLRGLVKSSAGSPLASVKVSVLGHPEYGHTLTRANGLFDMAVNGGGVLTLEYEKAGLLPSQRQVQAPWQDYAWLPEVVLIPLDSRVAAIALDGNTAQVQVAQGSPIADADGARQATVLFPPGTQASLVRPDGSTQPLSTLHVRATEYTVGASGPKSMPGALPASSGYTYAVELSVDEALAAGIKDVRFSQPLPVYVDNFLDFPVGGIVPAGWYDKDKAAWIPSTNGRVLKVLGVQNGLALLDTDGDEAADSPEQLATLGISEAERARTAGLYPPGKSLWRIPVSHFTPWDYNWPYGPPDDALAPDQPEPTDGDDKDTCDGECGSIISIQNQTLSERVPVTGTPFSLHYSSERVPGRTRKLHIPLSGASVPASLKRIELEIQVAGRKFSHEFPASPNRSYDFDWDGRDAYGRALRGAHPADVSIGYVYGAAYKQPAQFDDSFAAFGEDSITGDSGRGEVTLWQRHTAPVEAPASRRPPLGGWTLSLQHTYDPKGRVLHEGTGSRRSVGAAGRVISTVGGNGNRGFSGDGGPATQAELNGPSGVESAPDGSLYIADSTNHRIRKISAGGIITTVAGNGEAGFSGDGGPATNASLLYPTAIALGPDGSLYIGDVGSHRIRKVSPSGIITTVAGNGEPTGPLEEGVLATETSLASPVDVVMGPDGSLYISDINAHCVRRISPKGIITTVAGTGARDSSGDGGPAKQAALDGPAGLALGPDGSLYIADAGGHRIRKVSPSGIITTVAGNGIDGFTGDGGPATSASLTQPWDVAYSPDGSLYIADFRNGRIRRVSPSGTITTIAGNGSQESSGEGGLATQEPIAAYGLAIGPQGNLYVTDVEDRIRKVGSPLPGFDTTDLLIASEDGEQVYQFDSAGRHLSTRHSRTGAVLYTFNYSNGLLTQIQDGSGNTTRIEWSATGNPLAIVAPDGQRTTLTLEDNGWLASISNPAGETYRMQYTASGLLTGFTNPRNHSSTLQYDSSGLLVRDTHAAGGFWSLSRTLEARGRTVTLSSAGSRTTTYRIENLSTGDERRTNTFADGTQTAELMGSAGVTTRTGSDGTVVTTTEGPDPRFGMQAPLTTQLIVTLPSGLAAAATTTREVSLANPSNPLSLTQETTTFAVNDRPFTTVYTAANRQYTHTTPESRTSTLRIDPQGRPILIQSPGVAAVSYGYDGRGRLATVTQGTEPGIRTLAFAYGTDGYVRSVTDAASQQVLYQHDSAGRITQATLPGNRVTRFGHDANGNLTSLTPPGRPAHTFSYSPVDLESEYAPPPVGLPQPATAYQYNLDKQLTSVLRPDGITVTLGYQPNGRPASISPSANGEAVTFGYHATTGQLTSVATPSITLGYTFDGFLLQRETFSGALSGTIARTYDEDLRVSSVTVNGATITLGYDGDGLLTQAGALTFDRDAATGFITGTALGSVTTAQDYNAFGELASFTATAGATQQLSYTLGYDTLGRITTRTETIAGATTLWEYGYDLASRLATVKQDGVLVRQYGYDANGNRTHLNGAPIGSYDDQDRMQTYGNATYQYGANGELERKTDGTNVTQYRYDIFGNLKQVTLPDGTQIEYLTDGRNRRVGKKVNGAVTRKFLYQDQLKVVAELDASNTVVSRFHYGTKENVPEYMTQGSTNFRIITDYLGSVRFVVNTATGVIAQRMDYDEWGNVTLDTNPGLQPFGFAGGLQDNHTKLVRFGARDYNPATGGWAAKDPIRFKGRSVNLYAYAENAPVTWIDPSGLSPIDVEKIIKRSREITEQMTRNGERIDPGWLNNSCFYLRLLSVQQCGEKAYQGCKSQSQDLLEALEADIENGSLVLDDRWRFEQVWVVSSSVVHFFVHATSSNPGDRILRLDPHANAFNAYKRVR